MTFQAQADTPQLAALRREVREFVASERPTRSYEYLGGDDPEFSRKLGEKGWIGMCWPRAYGGSERSLLERYVIAEELLVARAPLGFHWIGDRQAGPLLLRYGTEEQKAAILPRIAAGTCRFCIGMSEADSGSDLASVRTKATAVSGGFVLTGAKLWTSGAHRSDFMIALCRTGPRGVSRHEGLSQFLIDLRAPGVECRQIENIARERDFNEVVFHDMFVPANCLVGGLGEGWKQVSDELALERSGPERFLSSFGLLLELLDVLKAQASPAAAREVGRLVAHLATVRHLSRSVAGLLQQGEVPALEAAIVKDIGTNLEQEMCEVVRTLAGVEPDPQAEGLAGSLAQVLWRAPSFTLRGGTREVLRGIIARGVGAR
ncbi:MAG: acyl-CoA dehydrogenase family protein [Pigmentiphaga sp.]|nr:acyl-CoA dehydrogenase family protein [Pigmentiphaga sp.]